MKTLIASLMIAALLPLAAEAQSNIGPGSKLSPVAAFTKIRERLMGDWPTQTEWEELETEMAARNCNRVECLDGFFKKKIAEYTATPRYIGRMALKVEELFYLRSGSYSWDQVDALRGSNNNASERNNSDVYNSFSSLVRRVFRENLSWDQIYTAKEYEVFPTISNGGSRQEYAFYNMAVDPQISFSYPSDIPQTKLYFLQNPNTAGVFSTPRFLNRFWNSSLNQGRKRSAAVFRTMICDSLFPSLERKSQSADEAAKALGLTEKAIANAHTNNVVNKHATDPACIRCHERLDPLAWTMRGLEVGLSRQPFPGKVRFYDTAGKLTNFNAENFSEAIATITKQDKYVNCQMDHFVRWIIGKDVTISPERLSQLSKEFDRMGRKTNDFISYLLTTPEFLTRPMPPQRPVNAGNRFEKAVSIFANCVQCHGSSHPFNDLNRWDLKRVTDIANRFDLAHDGHDRTMPPAGYDRWQPTAQDIKDIKDWISAGAPGVDGEPAISTEDAAKVLEQR